MSPSRQCAVIMELHRKQQLMANKNTARGAISFDSPPPAKSSKLKSLFPPTRSAADITCATQTDEDFERDSLAPQSSRTTARIRLQEKYVKVATLYKDECSPEEAAMISRCARQTKMSNGEPAATSGAAPGSPIAQAGTSRAITPPPLLPCELARAIPSTAPGPPIPTVPTTAGAVTG